MGRTGIIVTGIIGAALVVAAIIAFGQKDEEATPPPAANTSSTALQSETATTTITYNGSSFSPNQATVKKGDTVVFKNDSSQAIQIQSNPHPIHSDMPELNIGLIEAGQSQSITLSSIGSWGYHNHLNPTQTATIIIR
ncbi:cupredoxin domain-containing protein [Candidatus Saccharibacteria bacterium]|nr:cupredoxin domain-containing protein [Candidatus Saccharibacteria bacterium]